MHDIFFDLENLRKTANEEDESDQEYWFFGQSFTDSNPETKEKSKGCVCKTCNEFSPYAESNQEDGSFKCYSCKMHG